MSSPELVSSCWEALLALTLGLSLVLMARGACRRWLGAETAFQLWWLPWVLVLASQLPHPIKAAPAVLPSVVVTVTSAASNWQPAAATPSAWSWQTVLPGLWLLGTAWLVARMVVAQRLYRRQLTDARRMTGMAQPETVLRASRSDIGPALVGLWRPCIVVPGDFEQRYDERERALILAHEAAHASRRDVWWSLLAEVTVAICWFHPLVWFAQRAFHLDQELACDATVLRAHAGQQRIYAQAMLKTQATARSLPVGCSWSVRHPMMERIAMLKQLPPGRMRRAAGHLTLSVLALTLAGGVFAATGKGQDTFQPTKAVVDEAYRSWEHARDAYMAYMKRAGGNVGASNAALGLPGADSGSFGKSVSRLEVIDGGHIIVTLADARGAAGHLDFFVMPTGDGSTFQWQCSSPDIPGIASLRQECRYVPAPTHAERDLAAKSSHRLKLALSLNGEPARLHADACLADGKWYEATEQGIPSQAPWKISLTVLPQADPGMLMVVTNVSGGTLNGETIHPTIVVPAGTTGGIQYGQKVVEKDGTVKDRTVRMDVTPSIGC